jgi:hypothetical protein
MPMTADGALWAYAHEDEYPDMGGRGEAAIREAFEVRDRAREELEMLDKEISLDPRADTFESHRTCRLLKRILGEEGSE